MGNGRPFIPEHERRRSERDNSRIRTPYRHLVDPQDPYYYEICIELMMMDRAGVEINETAADIATKLVRHKLGTEEELEARRRANQERNRQEQEEQARRWADERTARDRWRESDGIVYYILRGGLVKIGTTTQPMKRFGALMPDAVLATEPGDAELEKIRHTQFADVRDSNVGNEYFHPHPPLVAHIRALREKHGVPNIPHASLMTREKAEVIVAELLAS
ncbi:GIY-YIG nuclease family protein [Streptomyces sp.]|uniref:GIY-YIG nuclease family protein n=1 Tax=Streptomyces sp. TaxID=1931 RepID=UPI002F94CDC9